MIALPSVIACHEELAKLAATGKATAMGALAGLPLGALAGLIGTRDEASKDRLLRDLGQMPDYVYKARQKRRASAVGATAAGGAAIGAAVPHIAQPLIDLVRHHMTSQADSAKAQARTAAQDEMQQLARIFRDEMQHAADYHANALKGVGPSMAENIGEGGRRSAEHHANALSKIMAKDIWQFLGLR